MQPLLWQVHQHSGLDLCGTTMCGADNENIVKIDDVVLERDKLIAAVVVGVAKILRVCWPSQLSSKDCAWRRSLRGSVMPRCRVLTISHSGNVTRARHFIAGDDDEAMIERSGIASPHYILSCGSVASCSTRSDPSQSLLALPGSDRAPAVQ